MKIVFFGTPDWAVPSLEALVRSSRSPSLVVTQPQKRRDRGGEISASPVARAAARLALPVIAPESVRTQEFQSRLAAESPELIVVVAYGRIFPARLLELPRRGAVNLHFSLLPKYRGAAPVQWAIADGEDETGVTTMRMAPELDAGPIYFQEGTAITPGEHAPALGARLAALGADVLVRTVEGILTGTLEPLPQDDARATHARLLRSADGWIDWSTPAATIARRVRAFDPWPGQTCAHERGKIKIIEARAAPGRAPAQGASAPGAGVVLGVEHEAIRISCGGGTVLEALVVQPEGRRAMKGSEALRGRHIREGERLDRGGDEPHA